MWGWRRDLHTTRLGCLNYINVVGEHYGISFTLAARTNYVVTCSIGIVPTFGDGAGFGITGPASPTNIMLVGIAGTTGAGVTGWSTTSFGPTSGPYNSQNGALLPLSFTGVIENGTNAGTFQMQFESISGGAVVAKQGSTCSWLVIS